jgi:hypothetical protein
VKPNREASFNRAITPSWDDKRNPFLVLGAVVAGVLLAYIYVFVVAYAAPIIYRSFRYLGQWAFFLNGTASALLLALVTAVPLGAILPRLAIPIAWIAGTVASALFLYFGAESLRDALWWVTVTDALQLGLMFLGGAWLGSRLRTPSANRT